MSQLNVGISSSPTKPGGFQEILLVKRGPDPKFEEAKVLIQNSVNLIQTTHKDVLKNTSTETKGGEIINIDVEDVSSVEDGILNDLKQTIAGLEDVSSDDTFAELKENVEEPSGSEVFLGCSQDGLCAVTLDTRPGYVHQKNLHLESSQTKENSMQNSNRSNKRSTRSSTQESPLKNLNTHSSDAANSGLSNCNDDSVIIDDSTPCQQTRSCTKQKLAEEADMTITLEDDTIIISSCSESEDDIKIEKVIDPKSDFTPKTATKRSKLKRKRSKSTPSTSSLAGADFISLRSRGQVFDGASPSPKGKQKVKKTSRFWGVSTSVSEDNATPSRSNSKSRVCPNKRKASDKKQKTDNVPQTSNADQVKQPSSKEKVKHSYDDNVISADSSSSSAIKKTGLRPVIIDGMNLSRESGSGLFSFQRLETGMKYFQDRNHKVIVFLPRHIQGVVGEENRQKMLKLETENVLCFTPSRKLPEGKRLAAYDDRFIVQAATELGGVIVSNDNYRDLMTENDRWKETIENRLLMYTWVGNMLMFPNDPLGRNGPHLEEFLRFPDGGE